MTDEPRIMFITRKWAPAVGGMETYSMRLAETLEALEPIKVVALPGRPNGMPPSALALLLFPLTVLHRWLSLDHPPKIIHVADMASWPLALISKIAPKDTRVVISAHGTDVSFIRRSDWKGWFYRCYLRIGSKLLSQAKVIANSQATADCAHEAGWGNIAVVPLATDISALPAESYHDGTILFAGRLIPLKGCRWFAQEVLPHLPEGTRLRIAGPAWDDREKEVMNHPRVDYLGVLDQKDLIAAYRRAACVIMPNIVMENGQFEGFGLVAAEAACAGGLVIAANSGGLPSAVISGESGLLLPPGDATKWIEQITLILSQNADERGEFLRRAQRRAKAYYNWGRVCAETLTNYGLDGRN